MHELSLACQMVEEVEAIAEREGATEILSLTLAVGALSGVDREALEFAYPAAIEGTKLEKTKLHIVEVPAVIRCDDCGAETEPDLLNIICGACHSVNVEIIDGKDLIINAIELNT